MASQALERVRKRADLAQSNDRGAGQRQLTWAAVVLGAGSSVLTLLGYGAVRANDALFGLSYALWFDTPLDLLTMSGDPVLALLIACTNGFGGLPMWRDAGITSGLVAVLVLTLLTGQWLRTSPVAAPWRRRCLSGIEACALWLFSPQQRFGEHVARASVTAAAAGVLGGLSVISGLALISLVLAAVSFVPLIGFIGASTYAKVAIIEPPSCISPVGVRMRTTSTAVGAPCVELTEPSTGKTVVGRLILARGSRVFLYSKEADRAFMFTTKDASMATIHRIAASAVMTER